MIKNKGQGISIEKSNSALRIPRSALQHCLLLFVYCLLLAVLPSCSGQKGKIYKKGMILMDTLITINVAADSKEQAENAMDKAFEEIEKIDKLINFFSDKSELAEINRKAGLAAVKVSPDTLELIEKAVYAAEKTYGAFDVTIGPESSLWDFPAKKKPDAVTIRKNLNLVNYKWIVTDKVKSTVYLREKGMLIDLGGIAKGYAADKAAEVLKRNGIKGGLVSCAGDIRAFGLKPDGKGWMIGIRNPRMKGKDDEIMATIELKDMAVSTSGDYERYFILDGKRYHHILDPKTGYPAEGTISVSVVAPYGVYTDSFSTAVFILGPEKGMQVLQQMGFEGVFVDSSQKILTTPGLKGKIEFKRDN